MLKRIICTVLLVVLGFGISANASAANRYKWITSTDKVNISYDTQTVRYYSNNGKMVDVWIYWRYTEDGARQTIEEKRGNGYYLESKWDNYSETVNHVLFNSNNQMDLFEVVHYDAYGNVLESKSMPHKWDSIIPGSIGEDIYNTFALYLKGK